MSSLKSRPRTDGRCECDCGELTTVRRGRPQRFRPGHQFRTHKQSRTPRYRKNTWLTSKYGITIEQYEQMVAEQGGLCGICGESKKLYVDHDHATGAVRGLLCNRCNIRLAALDDPEWMERAQAYHLAQEVRQYTVWAHTWANQQCPRSETPYLRTALPEAGSRGGTQAPT